MRYLSDCIFMCGNAFDPTVYAHWEGPHAVQFLEALLEVKLVGDAPIHASSAWKDRMVQVMGEDYVIGTQFNCDNRFSPEAAQLFQDVEVTAISFGHQLAVPECF